MKREPEQKTVFWGAMNLQPFLSLSLCSQWILNKPPIWNRLSFVLAFPLHELGLCKPFLHLLLSMFLHIAVFWLTSSFPSRMPLLQPDKLITTLQGHSPSVAFLGHQWLKQTTPIIASNPASNGQCAFVYVWVSPARLSVLKTGTQSYSGQPWTRQWMAQSMHLANIW